MARERHVLFLIVFSDTFWDLIDIIVTQNYVLIGREVVKLHVVKLTGIQ